MWILKPLGGCIVLASIFASPLHAAEKKEVTITLADCPAAVRKTLNREANGAAVTNIFKEVHNGKSFFETDVKIDGKNYEVILAEDGTLLEKRLDDDEGEEEETVEKITLANCPSAVQKTLKREANGATVDDVDKETDHGKTIYEVDVKIDGKNYEINVAADGTLISKALDEEEEEEEEDE